MSEEAVRQRDSDQVRAFVLRAFFKSERELNLGARGR